MERLKERDFRHLLQLLREIYAIRTLDDFIPQALLGIRKLIPSEIISYDEMDAANGTAKDWVIPSKIHTPTQARAWQEVMHEHPTLIHFQKTRRSEALKISDFLSQRQFRDTGLYSEHYRRLGVDKILTIPLAAVPPLAIGIALHRSRRDFSERERLILDMLGPHLIQAWYNAKAFTRTQRDSTQIQLVTRVLEELDQGVVLLGPDGKVRVANTKARQWVAEYCGKEVGPLDRLPEALQQWVRRQELLLREKSNVPPPRKPLLAQHEGKRLVLRLISNPAQSLLLLEEQCTVPQPDSLKSLGLTRRETEVVRWLAIGKTNAEIGLILDISPRTVHKHLEHIYQKLGVENRTGAAMRALEVLPR